MRDFSAVDDDASRRQQMTELYVDHHSWLQNWLRKKLGCSQRAADLAHDAFVRILTLTEPLNLKEPRAFLATTATRLLIDGARRRKVERAYLDALALHADETSIPSPEAIHAALQILERIARLLEGLPEKPRQAFLLHRLDGLTYSEIATHLGVSSSMVKQYMASVMVHCYKALHGSGHFA
ncbi:MULTISPECIES: sigma-70 family RNA polymerase sigma factor [Pseudomonas syringae group]|uniref:RNA polymerase sigma-70 protein n=1 Tax=Pseudomonas syringae pv. ribicola TaxID=55398 RepID=A0A3M2VUE4_PSESI|nr:sigma-70 family RNA polymerase sigma factor [Pseudomonas syringae group genomosp. 3]POD74465.1 RNA polymerase subunit sigma [Pseudomonas syringae group genomosp. 3]RML42840.1 RNA polymerase sigma-70 protein [Pseudomonas syringae pv. ribicola]